MPKISVITPTIRGEEGLYLPRESLSKQTFRDFEWLFETHNPEEPPDFNQSMNRMIKKSQGELLVFLQDFITINKHGLEYFWQAYQKHPEAFFTAPVGKTLDGDHVEWEWRAYRSNDEDLEFVEWEIDWGSAPKKLLKEIGGFDEELDKYWGFDNVNVGERINMAGFKIKNLLHNKAIALDHNKFIQHPYQKLRNPDFHNSRLQDIRMGLKINYL